ncbi:hypothetical protein ACJJTC_010111 [Scirpophaga incertulas]
MHRDGEPKEHLSIPSARPSIHKHNNCIFATNCGNKMGRYGLKSAYTSQSKLSPDKLHQGVDEVDNIQSKHLSSSPISYRKYHNSNKVRRNSHNIPDSTTDDSDNYLLAKSLPANLPSYSSDESEDQSIPGNFFTSHDSISSTSNTSSCGNTSRCNSNSFEQTHNSNDEFTKHNNMGYKILGVSIVIVAVVYYYCIKETTPVMRDTNSNEENKFYEELFKIRKKYNIEDEQILEIQTGIYTIFEKNDTGSFIFLYDSNNENYDYKKFRNFMKEIATTSAQFLRKNSPTVYPIVIDSSQLNMQSYSELMHKYRDDISKTGVMLINDLEDVPARLAMAFHYFCDEYNPLVPKTAMFFTLNFSKCSYFSEMNSYVSVEKCLASKWNTLPKDNIKPLLARVVNVIIDATGIF